MKSFIPPPNFCEPYLLSPEHIILRHFLWSKQDQFYCWSCLWILLIKLNQKCSLKKRSLFAHTIWKLIGSQSNFFFKHFFTSSFLRTCDLICNLPLLTNLFLGHYFIQGPFGPQTIIHFEYMFFSKHPEYWRSYIDLLWRCTFPGRDDFHWDIQFFHHLCELFLQLRGSAPWVKINDRKNCAQ